MLHKFRNTSNIYEWAKVEMSGGQQVELFKIKAIFALESGKSVVNLNEPNKKKTPVQQLAFA